MSKFTMLPEVIRQRRMELGLRMDDCARLSGMTFPAWVWVESYAPKCRPNWERLNQAAQALGWTLDELKAAAGIDTSATAARIDEKAGV